MREEIKTMIYFTADTHFGHANIVKMCERSYPDVESMDGAHNAVGFVQTTELKPGQRTSVAAFFNMYFVSYLLKYVSYLFEGA